MCVFVKINAGILDAVKIYIDPSPPRKVRMVYLCRIFTLQNTNSSEGEVKEWNIPKNSKNLLTVVRNSDVTEKKVRLIQL